MWESRDRWLIVWKLAATGLGMAWLRWHDAHLSKYCPMARETCAGKRGI